MPLFLLLAVLAVLAAIAVIAAGPGGSMGTSSSDRSPWGELPVDGVDRAAVDALRFSLAFRGYRQDEVDEVLDRLVSELESRDRRIAELEGRSLEGRSEVPDRPDVDGRDEAVAPTED